MSIFILPSSWGFWQSTTNEYIYTALILRCLAVLPASGYIYNWVHLKVSCSPQLMSMSILPSYWQCSLASWHMYIAPYGILLGCCGPVGTCGHKGTSPHCQSHTSAPVAMWACGHKATSPQSNMSTTSCAACSVAAAVLQQLLLAVPGCSWLLLAVPSCSWLLLAPHGCSWLLLGAPGQTDRTICFANAALLHVHICAHASCV